MKLLITTALGLTSLAFAADRPVSVTAYSPDKPVAVHIDDPRTVTVGERSVVPVYLAQLQETMLVLPQGEKAIRVFVGDSSNWVVETGKDASELSRYISLKVKNPLVKVATLNVVSDHDKPYTFRLILSDEHCDSKVFIDADSQLAQAIAKPPVVVSAAEADRYKQEATEARAQAAAAQEKAQQAAVDYRSTYPEKLRFDYTWDHKAGDKFGVTQIFNDGTFTYIRANPQEAPALYEIKDGKPSLVQFDFKDGIYTVTKLMNKGYLAVGKERMNFEREN